MRKPVPYTKGRHCPPVSRLTTVYSRIKLKTPRNTIYNINMASKPTGGGNGGMASDKQTPATAAIGATKPKVFDQQGAIGKQFTGTFRVPLVESGTRD